MNKKTFALPWFDPSFALTVGLIACVVRVALKIGVGLFVGSVVLTGDGFHNLGDAGYLIAAFLIMWIVKWKRDVMHAGENLGVMFQFIVAWILAGLACYIFYQSLMGLFPCPACEHAVQSIFPFIPKVAPRQLEAHAFAAIMATLAISIAISWGLARYHIKAGMVSGYGMLITIGKETESDMLVEIAMLVGFTGVFVFGAPWLEYLGGVVVAYFIFHTAWELFVEAHNTFVQASVGGEFVEDVHAIVNSTYGVTRIVKLEAYLVLQAIRVKVWIETAGSAEANEDIQSALEERITAYAHEHDYSECRPDVYFALPDNGSHRDVYAVVKNDKGCFAAPSYCQATHLRICDVEYGEVVSAEDIPAPKESELVRLLCEKHVSTYRAWSACSSLKKRLAEASIAFLETPTIVPPHQ